LEGCKKVIDAGGSIGLFTKYMLNKGAEEVVTIECDDRSIKALISNFSYYPQVTIVPKALYSTEGEMELYWKEDNPLVNSLNIEDSEFSAHINPNSKTVPTTTLQKIIEQTGWESVDLLKIDIEGSEWEVLDSTPNTIFESIDKFLLEYHWPNGKLHQLISRMGSLGFKFKLEHNCEIDSDNGTILFYR
jgi:FkbM family methyltransferase